MTRRNRKAAHATAGAARCTATVCRGCCCGTPRSPGSTTPPKLAQLRAPLAGQAQVRVVKCLGACEHANLIVVQPSPEGRKAGGRPVRLGLVNDPDATTDIAAWIRDGGPGLAEPPGILGLYAFTPRRIRQFPES
ncbi:(2Fe-2S) ferredoxin domain-containing protein [Streptomyces sp. NPDC052396]|uniref:(2Fe-2S) ferredoxin domain-containing protein n=1 Tax=Streptomyces sp. NPDC052396 TaxID=3365689 RepID=UPI0037D88346